MHSFKYFVESFLSESSGKKTADAGMTHEVFTTHAFTSLLRTSSSPQALSTNISRAIHGDKSSKGSAVRIRPSRMSATHPLRKAFEKHSEEDARELYSDSTHTAAALAHYTSYSHGHPENVSHVGGLTAGAHNLKDSDGNKIDTNADIIIGAGSSGKKIKLLGNGLKYSTSDSGAGATKIFSPTHNTISKIVDAAHREAGIGDGTLHNTLTSIIENHSANSERNVYTRHHKALASIFGDVSDPQNPPKIKKTEVKGKKSPPAPIYDSSKKIRPINDSGMSHIRQIVDGRLSGVPKSHKEAAAAFYEDLQSSNRELQGEIAHHTHAAISQVMTNIGGNGRKRKAAANLYRNLNNANSSIDTIVVSTVKKPGMKKPDVHIYNHNASVEDHIRDKDAQAQDYSLNREPGTASFKVGKIVFGVDSRPGSSSIMLNGKIQNTQFKHEASYVSDPKSVSSKAGKTGRIFGWGDLRKKS